MRNYVKSPTPRPLSSPYRYFFVLGNHYEVYLQQLYLCENWNIFSLWSKKFIKIIFLQKKNTISLTIPKNNIVIIFFCFVCINLVLNQLYLVYYTIKMVINSNMTSRWLVNYYHKIMKVLTTFLINIFPNKVRLVVMLSRESIYYLIV